MNAPTVRPTRRSFCLALSLAATLSPQLATAAPSASGDTGLIAMPSARVDDDGTMRAGFSYSEPYASFFASMTLYPGIEGAFQFSRLGGVAVPGTSGYGSYKDKQLHLKWRFLDEDERGWSPAIAIGVRDLHGTQLFPAQYLVASKRLGEFDLALGYGTDRMDGAFGGVVYSPKQAPGFSATLEYDANEYASDPYSIESGAVERTDPLNFGVQYKGGDWGIALTSEGGELGGKLWLSFAFGQADLTPKTKEPAPLTKAEAAAPPAADWSPLGAAPRRLAEQLYAQGYDRVEVALDGTRLDLRLTHQRISLIGRAVGRAARTALLYGPSDARTMRITYTQVDLPIARYEFEDLAVLRDYFGGRVGGDKLAPTLTVRHSRPEDAASFDLAHLQYSRDLAGDDEGQAPATTGFKRKEDRNPLKFERSLGDGTTLGVKPLIVNGFFNDLGGAFRYDIFAAAFYNQRIAHGLYGTGTARLTLLENVSEVDTLSNSTLPHVRSDIALYKAEGPLKLENLYLSKYLQVDERVFLRLSSGFYEEMFFGTGGQALYLPEKADWAFDLSVEYAHQRDYDGGFELLDYNTVTALGALHYRFPKQGITATVRGGVFLAGDEGYRFELQRRLRSGVAFGFWYTITNGNDITAPGTPEDPYYDKGVFIAIPLRITLPHDSKASGSFSLSPWTRDVGAMIRFPGDLYTMFENTLLLNTTDYNPLSQFGR